MKRSTRDKAKGAFHELKGKLKAQAGILTADPKLEAEGRDEQVAGMVQKVIGKVEQVVGE